MSRLKYWIRDKLYPNFDCEDCIGMIQYGCQCDYYEAFAPGSPPGFVVTQLRKIYKWVFDTKKDMTF